MKTPGLSTKQSIALLSMWSGFATVPDETDIRRLSACGYVAPEGPVGNWRVTEAGEKRVYEMTGQREVFDTRATDAVLSFLGKADLKAWTRNLSLTGDMADDIIKIRNEVRTFALRGSKLRTESWKADASDADLCARLCYGLADVARSELVDWAAVYDLFRAVEID